MYYFQKLGKDESMLVYEYGELVLVYQILLFFGQLVLGEFLQVGYDMIYYLWYMIFMVNGYVVCLFE